jgi:hypothetical protein
MRLIVKPVLGYTEPGSQHRPLPISSNSDLDFQSDGEPRRSGHVKKPTQAVESQQWQINHGLIPAPGAKGKVRALNAKKRKNAETSQFENEFELLELFSLNCNIYIYIYILRKTVL